MLNTTVLALGILTNGHNVDVVVERPVAFHRATGSNVGVQREDSKTKR